MNSLAKRSLIGVGSGMLGLLVTAVAGAVWGPLYITNLKTTPAIPWSVPVMAVALWLMWRYLGGQGWPKSTSEARRRNLRAKSVSAAVFSWAFLAGVLSIAALAGLWIIMFQLFRMQGNVVPDQTKFPLLTMALFAIMGSLVSPLSEEAGFRGYCQSILERNFSAPLAVGISSVFFALAHLTQGFYLPKLLVYFLGGVMLGVTANLTKSILPGIAVHILADMTFFTMVWPYDAARRVIWDGGNTTWFWIHVAQAVVFSGLAILAYRRLASLNSAVAHANNAMAVGSGLGVVSNHEDGLSQPFIQTAQ
jgi:membrane protease YdiL (CAAX protease family)